MSIVSRFMTRRRWVIAGIACVGLTAALILVLLNQTAEPIVQGRKLSAWLSELRPAIATAPRPQFTVARRPPMTPAQARAAASQPAPARPITLPADIAKHTAAVKAIREIGTNAIPHLMSAIYARDGKFKTWCMKWVRKQNVLKIRFAEEKRGQALSAMSVLGADALWSWVEIVTNDLADSEVQVYAAQRISSFGEAAMRALPALLTMDNHREPRAWSTISWAIQQCDRKGVLPTLRNVRSNDPELRASAAWSLGFISDFPDVTIPALVNALEDSNAKVRVEALHALAKYGANATATSNAVYGLTSDAVSDVRDAATNALERISSPNEARE